MSLFCDDLIQDIPYVDTYFREFTPSYVNFLSKLYGGPGLPKKKLKICDLGCGTGYNALFLAALYPEAEITGYDYAKGAINAANANAKALGLSNIRFEVTTFEALEKKTQDGALKFDLIQANGIFSWVSRANQDAIIRFSQKALTEKGHFAFSYNCHPGRSYDMILRPLLEEMLTDKDMSEPKALIDALEELDNLANSDHMKHFEHSPNYVFNAYGNLKQKIATLKHFDPSYVAHEYMADNLEIFFSNEMLRRFKAHALSFICSGRLFTNSPPFKTALWQNAYPVFDRVERTEITRDFLRNESLRQDIMIHSNQKKECTDKIAQNETLQNIAQMTFAALKPAQSYDLSKFENNKALQSALYKLIGAFEKPKTLRNALSSKELKILKLEDAVFMVLYFLEDSVLTLCDTIIDMEPAYEKTIQSFNHILIKYYDTKTVYYILNPWLGATHSISETLANFLQKALEQLKANQALTTHTLNASDQKMLAMLQSYKLL